MTNFDLDEIDENIEVPIIKITTETMVQKYGNKPIICEYIKWKKPDRIEPIPKETIKWINATNAYEWIDILNGICKEILNEYNIQYDNKPNTMETIYKLVDTINRSNHIPFKLSWQILLYHNGL